MTTQAPDSTEVRRIDASRVDRVALDDAARELRHASSPRLRAAADRLAALSAEWLAAQGLDDSGDGEASSS